jgi:hypothetical protein
MKQAYGLTNFRGKVFSSLGYPKPTSLPTTQAWSLAIKFHMEIVPITGKFILFFTLFAYGTAEEKNWSLSWDISYFAPHEMCMTQFSKFHVESLPSRALHISFLVITACGTTYLPFLGLPHISFFIKSVPDSGMTWQISGGKLRYSISTNI